jgi:UDP-N-acetylmuramoyl-tripeptide--D-alanyl-D-alanine ligase
VTGPVVIDSRASAPGALFAALPGTRADGHDFAAAAVAAGAAVLATRPVGVPALLVPDVTAALARLARAVVDALPDLVIVGITGSSGKTTTKDLAAQLIETLGPTVSPRNSYNNEIGHPLTVLRVTERTRYLISELSARGPGHIAMLCGVAVLNADDPRVLAMAARTAARVVTFGRSPGADVRAADIVLDELGRPGFTLITEAGSAAAALRLHGAHNVTNALAAAALAGQLGMTVSAIADGLSAAVARSRWRMEVTQRPDGVAIINDAWNTNPEALRAALAALAVMAGGRRTFAVLSQMRELGAQSAELNEQAGAFAARTGLAGLIVVGSEAAPMLAGAKAEPSWPGELLHVADGPAAVQALSERLRPGDVVLVKGSRAAGLERVALALTGEALTGEAAL